MLRLSSNITLFLKLFLPVFWTTVLTGITLVIWLSPEHYFGGVSLTSLRYGMTFVLLTWLGLSFFVLWPLKRVETDGEYVYVSNYFRTARYHLIDDVRGIIDGRLLFFRVCTLELKGAGAFGKRVRFIASRKQFNTFRAEFAGAVEFQ
ncbi:hypothetical protein LEM8419_03359 [Neolewinella maritima]|uniref:PH domain-containing protein n=1 Tax=Neolewinella maritima TaxID=1383882 RepID=A0ABM9B688_9BACT|nr:hypothetical protein [Neolewinella maritima]CAH1002480.1 hypothetical protein LEM8419_03359 [Neolewinella maritima]